MQNEKCGKRDRDGDRDNLLENILKIKNIGEKYTINHGSFRVC